MGVCLLCKNILLSKKKYIFLIYGKLIHTYFVNNSAYARRSKLSVQYMKEYGREKLSLGNYKILPDLREKSMFDVLVVLDYGTALKLATFRRFFDHLTPNDHFSGRTAPLTSRCCIFLFIQQIYVLNILNMLHTLCLFLFKMPFIS